MEGRGEAGLPASPDHVPVRGQGPHHLALRIYALPSAGVLIAGARLVAAQYADDCIALLRSCDEGHVHALLSATEAFALATGQRLNLKKCQILPLGSQPSQLQSLPSTPGSIPVCTSANTLGTTFSDDLGEQLHPRAQPQHGPWQGV